MPLIEHPMEKNRKQNGSHIFLDNQLEKKYMPKIVVRQVKRKVRFKTSIFQNSQCEHVTHIKQHLQVNTESLKSFSVSSEPEQRSLMSPHRLLSRAPLLSFQSTWSHLQTGLEIYDSFFGFQFLGSTQTTILPTHCNWEDDYFDYMPVTDWGLLCFFFFFLLNMGHTWVFSWKFEISHQQKYSAFLLSAYTQRLEASFSFYLQRMNFQIASPKPSLPVW